MRKLILFAAAIATPGGAHIVMSPSSASADSYYAGAFRVGHGCGEAATTAVRIELPENVLLARPQPKAGWKIEIERISLTKTNMTEGHQQVERVSAITWRGNLPADQFDEFGVMLKIPKGMSGALYLPLRQTCGTQTVEWTAIPSAPEGWGSLKNPAPMLSLEPAAGHRH